MAFSVAVTTTNKIENYTTPGDVTGQASNATHVSCRAGASPRRILPAQAAQAAWTAAIAASGVSFMRVT